MNLSNTLHCNAEHQRKRRDKDRISQLSDPILQDIFRYLTTKDIVCSSVLSKRWRTLWASMQYLVFDEIEFETTEHFTRFTDTVLVLRDPLDVREFRLKWHYDYDESRANLWIRYAIRHNVRVLHLDIDPASDGSIKLPHHIFTSRSIEELHVSLNIDNEDIHALSFLGPSKIRSLNLDNVSLDRDVLGKLLYGCPMIEVLHLKNCWIMDGDIPCVRLTSRTMRSLLITNCCSNDCDIIISIPSLVDLHYEYSNFSKVSLEDLLSLDYAFISDSEDYYYKPTHYGDVVEFIKGLSNAESLELLGPWIELVNEKELPEEFPTFQNLRSLIVGDLCMSDNFQAVAFILQHSPNLERLTLKDSSLQRSRDHCEGIIWKSDKLSFDCPRLKMIEIRCAKRNKRVHELVKILLANSRAFHRIMICPW